MLTRCPACSTTFRVTPTQLKARAGKVRCGQCSFVFNALDTLDDDTNRAIENRPAVVSKTEPAVEVGPPADDVESPAPNDGTEVDAFDIGEEDISATTEPQAEALPETEIDAPTAEIDTPEPGYASETDQLTDYLAGPSQQEPATSGRRWPWIAGSVVAVLVFLLQGLYYYRVEVAVIQPGLRPLLQAACKPFRCDVPRPRSIETLSIEASDLRPDPEQAGRLTLAATLRSKAPYAQEWPLLELTLTDVADSKLAVKDFAAVDYLPKEENDKDGKKFGARLAAGFPANGEIAVTLPLDVGDLPAAGYRLYIFYP